MLRFSYSSCTRSVAVSVFPWIAPDTTATLQVQDDYENFNTTGAYAVSLLLAILAVLVLAAMMLLRPKEAAS